MISSELHRCWSSQWGSLAASSGKKVLRVALVSLVRRSRQTESPLV